MQSFTQNSPELETQQRFIHLDLVEACRNGNRAAQSKIYRLYYRAMYNASLRILNDPAEAEDAMQEGFIAAFQRLDTYAGDGSFGSWLKRIVVNHSLDLLRKRKEKTSIEEAGIELVDDNEEESEEEILYKVREIKMAMQQLNEDYRVILSLSLFEGYDHEEISDILNISYNNVRTRFSRARQRLLQLISENRMKEQIQYN